MATRKKTQKQSFESGLEQLGAYVEEIESGALPLEESMRIYEEGMQLYTQLSALLKENEKRIEMIQKETINNGDAETMPFLPEEEHV